MKVLLQNASRSVRKLNPHLCPTGANKTIPSATGIGRKGRRGVMNTTETEFAMILEAQKRKGEILRYEFEGMTLRFSGVKYTPDFVVFEDCEAKLLSGVGGSGAGPATAGQGSHCTFTSAQPRRETADCGRVQMRVNPAGGIKPIGLQAEALHAGTPAQENNSSATDSNPNAHTVSAQNISPVREGNEKLYRLRLIEIKGGYTKGKFERAVERFRHARTYFPELTFELWRKSKDFGWRREL